VKASTLNLDEWAENQAEKGFSDEKIRSYLQEKGFSDERIDKALRGAEESTGWSLSSQLIVSVVVVVVLFLGGGYAFLTVFADGGSDTSGNVSQSGDRPGVDDERGTELVSYYDDSFAGYRNVTVNPSERTVVYKTVGRRNLSVIEDDYETAVNRSINTACGVASAAFYNYDEVKNSSLITNIFDGEFRKRTSDEVESNVSIPEDVFTNHTLRGINVSVESFSGEDLARCDVTGPGQSNMTVTVYDNPVS